MDNITLSDADFKQVVRHAHDEGCRFASSWLGGVLVEQGLVPKETVDAILARMSEALLVVEAQELMEDGDGN